MRFIIIIIITTLCSFYDFSETTVQLAQEDDGE